MNSRIKDIRKQLGLNQTDFGNKIGVKQGSVAAYESGTRIPLDSVILSICREFNVNEEWLRTGNGDPFMKLEVNDMVAKATVLLGKHDPLFESIIEIYSKLDDVDRKTLMKITEDLTLVYQEKNKQ